MFGMFSASNKPNSIWTQLSSAKELEDLYVKSNKEYVVIFKHSTRCSISSMAKNRLENNWQSLFDDFPIYYLDLIAYRSISNAIASDLQVEHESPQIIIVYKGKAIYNASHGAIDAKALKSILDK